MGILGRFTAALVTALALMSTSVGAAQAVAAAGSAADPYSTRITTKTVVRTPSPIRTDTRISMTVKVTANSPTRPTGTLTVSLRSAPGGGGARIAAGAADWTRTVDYDGGTQRLVGPEFPETGRWLVTAVFTPDDAAFRGSRGSWGFEVVNGSGSGNGPGDDDNGGLLPDTGGPALFWLVLGLGLLGGGSASVLVARRRRTPALVGA